MGYDPNALSSEDREMWRGYYEEAKELSAATPKVGLMTLKDIPGEYRYAVAIRDEKGLWLTLWVRRSKNGEFFVMAPRGDKEWDPHTSYHLDGKFHSKSFGKKFEHTKKQPLNGSFQGTENLGGYGGHSASIGAICDPNAYNGVVEVTPDELTKGSVVVDLVQPSHKPIEWLNVTRETIFTDFVPHLVIRITS